MLIKKYIFQIVATAVTAGPYNVKMEEVGIKSYSEIIVLN